MFRISFLVLLSLGTLLAQTKLGDGPIIPTVTVSTLPAASAATGKSFYVSDSATGCTVGSGTALALCRSNGTSWIAITGAGGGNLTLVASDPSGSCSITVALQYNTSNGNLWGCDSGTWTLIPPTSTYTNSFSGTTWTITHNLNSRAVETHVFDSSWNEITPALITNTSTSVVTVTFDASTAGNAVVIEGGGSGGGGGGGSGSVAICVATGSGTAYVCAGSGFAATTGNSVILIPNTVSTASFTINVGTGAITALHNDGAAFSAGDTIPTSVPRLFTYDGTNFREPYPRLVPGSSNTLAVTTNVSPPVIDASAALPVISSANAFTGLNSFGAIESAGTTFTVSGCSAGSTAGGAQAGTFTSGSSTTCSFVITPGVTAAHGWSCSASDITPTTPVALPQSATSATTCTVKGTVTAADTIVFQALAY